uniref:Exocyst complex component 2 n=1 Tax=Artemia sinica TaxID=112780 RepID=A0A5C0C958_9CRUS|nr:Sec5 [Artemia sinica]
MNPLPIVTGVSPIEGAPGTKVIIRGENLGTGQKDLIGLTICNHDCLLSAEWHSPNKLIARSGPSYITEAIIVTTKSGGRGTCTVQFKGIEETSGPLKESAVWVNDSGAVTMRGYLRPAKPSALSYDDPLGLSMEGREALNTEELDKISPDGNSDICSPEFSIVRFLMKYHYATTFQDLKAGAAYLKRTVNSEREGKISFIKNNLGAIFDQLQTSVTLKSLIEVKDVPSTHNLEKQIEDVKKESDSLFNKVLEREKQAEELRGTFKIAKNYKFLFDLPITIDKNIKKGDYGTVVSDYARAVAFYRDTKSNALKRVLDTVESQMIEVRKELMFRLKQFPSNIEEQKNIIRHLVSLEYEGDIAFDVLLSFFDYIVKVMNRCMKEHLSREQPDLNKASNFLKTPLTESHELKQRNEVPRLVFLEELTDVLSATFPDFWRLGQSYFKGELVSSPVASNHPAFKRKVLDIIVIYNHLVRAALLPRTLDSQSEHRERFGLWPDFQKPRTLELTSDWLVECLKSLRSCRSFLEVLDLPKDVIQPAKKLVSDFREYSLQLLFESAVSEIRSLKKKENWVMLYKDDAGGITDLPFQFEQIISKAFEKVVDVSIRGDEGESSLLDESLSTNGLRSSSRQALFEFAFVLKSFYKRDSDNTSRRVTHEQRVLISKNNCQYTRDFIIPLLQGKATHLGLSNINFDDARDQYEAISKMLYECYLSSLCDPDREDTLVNLIEPHMYAGNFKWNKCDLVPNDVSPYVNEIVLSVVQVIQDTYSLNKNVGPHVVERIMENVANEIHRLMFDEKFSRLGAAQARADLLAMKTLFRPYLTESALRYFEDAAANIRLESKDQEIVDRILRRYLNKSRVIQMCLKR